MTLQIRDVESGEVINIDEDSRTIGRDPRRSDISISDPGVSGLHAKISRSNGSWLLEDLNSSNGSYVDGQRITAPVALRQGMQFALHRRAFEVMQVGEGTDVTDSETAMWVDDGKTKADINPMIPEDPSQEISISRTGPAPGAGDRVRPPGGGRHFEDDSGGFDAVDDGYDSGPVRGLETNDVASDTGTPLGSDEPLVPYLMKTVPKAFAYYLVAVPAMLVNPVGSIRKSVDEQKFEPMGRKEIIAWTLPALWFGVVVSTIMSLIVALVNGGFAVGLLIAPLISAAIMLVVAVVQGFIFHPVMAWIIKLLKGQSDAQSRSNYLVALMTAQPIGQLAAAIGTILTLVPVPFIGIIGPVVSLAGTVILLFVAFVWMKFFQVMKWVPIVILVLGGLSMFGTVTGMISIVKADIDRLRAGSTPGAEIAIGGEDTGEEGEISDEDLPPEVQEQIAKLKEAGAYTPEAAAAIRANYGTGDTEGQAAAQLQAAARIAEQANQGGSEAEAVEEPDDTAPEDSAAPPVDPPTAEDPPPADPDPPPAQPDPPPRTGKGSKQYASYASKRAQVERAIEENPLLLKRKPVQTLYRQLHVQINKMRAKYRPKKTRKMSTAEYQAEVRISERLAEAEIFENTAEIVDKLHGKLF